MIVCKRCGKCCYFVTDGKLTDKPCRFLIKHKNGLTSCRIFGSRLGKKIGPNNVCKLREEHHYNYEGCPYNNTEWEEIKHE